MCKTSKIKKVIFVALVSMLFMATIVNSGILGDINNDNKVNLVETIQSLQIVSGIKTNLAKSNDISWKNEWAKDYKYYPNDIINYNNLLYICIIEHMSSNENNPINKDFWKPFSINKEVDPTNNSIIQVCANENISYNDIPIAVCLEKNAIIINNHCSLYNDSINSSIGISHIYGVNIYAQTFKTDQGTEKISQIDLYISRIGELSEVIELAIYELDSSSIPINNPIITKTYGAGAIMHGWNRFNINEEVNSLTNYAIALFCIKGDTGKNIRWFYSKKNTYNDGVFLKSSDFGRTWEKSSDKDFAFKIYTDDRIKRCLCYNGSDFVGFTKQQSYKGQKINVQISGTIDGFHNLQAGKKYYFENGGNICANESCLVSVGYAVSNSQLHILKQTDEITSYVLRVSDNLKVNNNSEVSITSNNWSCAKQVQIFYGGTVRIKYELKSSNGQGYGMIKVNDSFQGSECQRSNDYYSCTHDVKISAGDVINLMIKSSSGTASCKNMKIYWDKVQTYDYRIIK